MEQEQVPGGIERVRQSADPKLQQTRYRECKGQRKIGTQTGPGCPYPEKP